MSKQKVAPELVGNGYQRRTRAPFARFRTKVVVLYQASVAKSKMRHPSAVIPEERSRRAPQSFVS
jgi:hypothetical protein